MGLIRPSSTSMASVTISTVLCPSLAMASHSCSELPAPVNSCGWRNGRMKVATFMHSIQKRKIKTLSWNIGGSPV